MCPDRSTDDTSTDARPRCAWPGTDPLYVAYHDTEWGVPELDPRALWEKLVLDGFQAGLSWITILRKREAFRSRFEGFDPERIASWGAAEIDAALADPGIIRHRGKIEATIRNARAWLTLQEAGGFAPFIWDAVGGVPQQPRHRDHVPSRTPESEALSAGLRRAGFGFVGPVIVYAFMEAVGLVNDHLVSCFRHDEVARLPGPGGTIDGSATGGEISGSR